MNLYKLTVLHGGPKSSCTAILGYMLAESDEGAYNRLNDEAFWNEADESYILEREEYPDMFDPARPTPKETIMKNCGDLKDENWDDAYYGIWKYGWENLGPITDEESDVLAKFKIV